MSEEELKLLIDHGYTVICESPFEIEEIHPKDGTIGTATGTIAREFLYLLKYQEMENE